MSDKFYIGLDLTTFQDDGRYKPISRVTLLADDENAYTAGDDSGMEVSASCAHATQAMADSLLDTLKGHRYQAYDAGSANLDPAAELGDGVNVGGVYAAISRISDDGSGYFDISAPGERELEEEYPSTGPVTQEFDRKLAATRSTIAKTAEEILLKVEATDGRLSSLRLTVDGITSTVQGIEGNMSSITQTVGSIITQITGINGDISSIEQTVSSITTKIQGIEGNVSSITQTVDSISTKVQGIQGNVSSIEQTVGSISTKVQGIQGDISSIEQTVGSITTRVQGVEGNVSSITQTVNSITSRVQGLEGNVSSIEQYVDKITLSVSNGATSSTITLKSGNVNIASQTISMNGLVTFLGLQQGTTIIDGACIKTGIIDANRINLTGSINFGDLSPSVQNNINDAYITSVNAQSVAQSANNLVSGWSYFGSTYIDGTKIMTGTVMASILQGGKVQLLDASERIAGYLEIGRASSSDFSIEMASYGALRFLSAGNMWFQSDGSAVTLGLSERFGISCGADTIPKLSGYYDLGSSIYRWSAIYADTGTIITSDRTKKHDIHYNLKAYDTFLDLLTPAAFQLNDGTSGRVHLGLVSQDVETALETAGLTSHEFGGFIKTPKPDGEAGYDYALRYEEFIPLCIRRIQALDARIKQLEVSNGDKKAFG